MRGHGRIGALGSKRMTNETRRLARVLMAVLPTVMLGGVSLLELLTRAQAGYSA